MKAAERGEHDSDSGESLPELEPLGNPSAPAVAKDPQLALHLVQKLASEKEQPGLTQSRPRQDPDLAQPCSDEICEQEYGYPRWPDEMKDPDYFRKEFELMRTDPRHNKNLGRGVQDQEFWNEAARMPWAKVLLRKEQFWTERRNVWLEQYDTVIKHNKGREEVLELLEECPIDVKRLVAPIVKYKIVESLLLTLNQEAKETGIPFSELIRQPETISELCSARQRLDDGGDEEAQRLQDTMDTMVKQAQQELAEERAREEKARGRTLIDMQGLKVALDFGQKCKKDGLVEWQRENFQEALASWRQGDETLRKFRAPRRCSDENGMLIELHSAVLRNLAQAAIKLENWSEAIEAADRILEMNSDDYKAWFRKACALEGMGNFRDARLCLDKIEEIAVGRVDRERLVADCRRKRDKFHVQEERHRADQQRMLQRGLRRGVFSGGRLEGPGQQQALGQHAGTLGWSESEKAVDRCERKRITRDGAWDLLADLEAAYTDPWFVKRVDKLIVDVVFDSRAFMERLGPVALDAQCSVLEKWGFEPSTVGLQEMRAALRDHTQGPRKDSRLQERAEEVNKALYGSAHLNMYERVMFGA